MPALLRAPDALRLVPVPPNIGCRLCVDETDGHELAGMLPRQLVDHPGEQVRGLRAKLAADAELDPLFTAGEGALHALLEFCPEIRNVLRLDLLNRNVLVAEGSRSLTAIFDWGRASYGEFSTKLPGPRFGRRGTRAWPSMELPENPAQSPGSGERPVRIFPWRAAALHGPGRQQARCRFGDLGDGAVEGVLIGLRRRLGLRAGDLPDELTCRRLDFERRRLRHITKAHDASAHDVDGRPCPFLERPPARETTAHISRGD
jgi:hypothetical protein